MPYFRRRRRRLYRRRRPVRRRNYPKRRRYRYAGRRTSRYSRRALPNARAITPTLGDFVPDFNNRQNMTWQTLYMNSILLPDLNSLIGKRHSSYIYMKGIKLTFQILNSINMSARIHMAILQERDNNNSDLNRRQNFFRDTTSETSRAHAFDNWVSGNQYDFRMSFNPICSDHYNVITHEVHTLDGKTEATNQVQRPFYKMKSKYYKINRRIAFDNVGDVINWKPFYVCFWWQPIDLTDYSATTGQTGVRFTYKTDVVYKNIM